MKLKTYRAYTMAEALAAVKRDLGADAVIVQTRTMKQGGLLGIGRKTIVEVTATPAERNARGASKAAPRRALPSSEAARKAYSAAASTPSRSQPSTDAQQRVDALAEMLRKSLDEKTQQAKSRASLLEPQIRRDTTSPDFQGVVPSQADRTRFIPLDTEQAIAPKLKVTSKDRQIPSSVPVRATSVAPPRESASAPPAARRFVLKADQDARDASSAERHARDLPLWESDASERARDRVPAAPQEPSVPEEAPEAVPSPAEPEVRPQPISSSDGLQDEMAAIRKMVGQILDRQSIGTARSTPRTPGQLFEMYTHLIAQEMSEELADALVCEVERSLEPSQLEDASIVRGAVLERLMALIPISKEPIISWPETGPLRLALIGPTGVGKTTTVAKLAATFKLKQRKNVGLITSDTYRIAAVEQLRTYANIIGLRLEVALTPAEMAQACHALRDCDVILIDTAGRSQRDRDKLCELQKFLDAASPHEVHLVLSSTASEKVLMQEAEAFSDVRADKIILTKLDEAVSFGMLVSVMKKVGKELSFVTMGQEVPEHIEPGRADRLAELVLEGALQG